MQRYPETWSEFEGWLKALDLEFTEQEDRRTEMDLPPEHVIAWVRFRGTSAFKRLRISWMPLAFGSPSTQEARIYRTYVLEILRAYLIEGDVLDPQEEAFILALRDDPDPAVLLVYADWLEERGDGERADQARRFVEPMPSALDTACRLSPGTAAREGYFELRQLRSRESDS